MGADITTNELRGNFFLRLEQNIGSAYLQGLAGPVFPSDQAIETYKFLGQVPAFKVKVAGRQYKSLTTKGFALTNVDFDTGLEVTDEEKRRDKSGQLMIRINELADRTNAHWASLIATLIINGESGLAYDGEFFFDTDHAEGSSGTQDNDISKAIVAAASPTAVEAEAIIMAMIQKMIGYKDNEGEPMNELARDFRIMIPVNYFAAFSAATNNPIITDSNGSKTNVVVNLGGYNITLDTNVRLTSTSKCYLFRTDGNTSPFIRQEEVPVDMMHYEKGSEFHRANGAELHLVQATRAAGYGQWQHALLSTQTTI